MRNFLNLIVLNVVRVSFIVSVFYLIVVVSETIKSRGGDLVIGIVINLFLLAWIVVQIFILRHIKNKLKTEEKIFSLEDFGLEGNLSLTMGETAYNDRIKSSGNIEADEFEYKFCKWIEKKIGSPVVSYVGTGSFYWKIKSYEKEAEFSIVANNKNISLKINSKWIIRVEEKEPWLSLVIEEEFLDKNRVVRETTTGNRIQFKAEELKEDSELFF